MWGWIDFSSQEYDRNPAESVSHSVEVLEALLVFRVSWANPDWSTEAFSITSVITFDPNLAAIFYPSALIEPPRSPHPLSRDGIRGRASRRREMREQSEHQLPKWTGGDWQAHATQGVTGKPSLLVGICNRSAREKTNVNKNNFEQILSCFLL